MIDETRGGLDALETHLSELSSWCDLIEAIADFLPCHVDEGLCRTLTRDLVPLLVRIHQLEETSVDRHPALAISVPAPRDEEQRRISDRLEQRGMAERAVKVLCDLSRGRSSLSADAIAYALRSFCCPARRHIKEERQLIGEIRQAIAVPSLVSDAKLTPAGA